MAEVSAVAYTQHPSVPHISLFLPLETFLFLNVLHLVDLFFSPPFPSKPDIIGGKKTPMHVADSLEMYQSTIAAHC